MRRRFFVDHFDSNSAAICGETAEHLGRVLRAAPGQLYELSDGRTVWLGRVERVDLPKRGESRIDFALLEPVEAREAPLRIILLLALVKFDRFEWCLEKATELGASEIVPLAAARSEKPLVAAAEKRRARWEKILLESSQQARRLRPPVLRLTNAPVLVARAAGVVLKSGVAFAQAAADRKIILSERPDAPSLRDVLGQQGGDAPQSRRVSVASLSIGPEGGWTDEEFAAARACGFAEASLGESILRTETAVLAAMAILGFALS
ncbi:MAG: 16S rRNA (uracil(1498)-N(3))-methyltransferase [Acidobacteriota bacterium]|nr:16S rRNA (uracil(1498)-N(3))-methyltransferase [Acidobacteriota bacterium]